MSVYPQDGARAAQKGNGGSPNDDSSAARRTPTGAGSYSGAPMSEFRREDDRLMGQLMEKVDQVAHDVGEIKRSLQWQNGRVRQLELWRSGLVAAWGTALLMMGVLAWIVEK